MKKSLRSLLIAGTVSMLTMGVAEASFSQMAFAEETETNTEEHVEVSSMEHPQFSAYGIRGVTVIEDGEEVFQIAHKPEEYKMSFDYWEILNPYDETMTVNTEAMYDMFSNLSGFNFSMPLPADEVKDTGLEETEDYIIVDFVNNLNEEEAKTIKDSDCQAVIKLGNSNGEGYRYVSLEGYEENVYKIAEILTESITELNAFDYILKITALVNNVTLENIELTVDDTTHTMCMDGETYKFNDKEVEKDVYTTLYQDILSIYLDSELQEEPVDGEEILKICYHKKEDQGPDVEIVYTEYDEAYDCVTINQEYQFLVKAEEVQTAIDKIKQAFE